MEQRPHRTRHRRPTLVVRYLMYALFVRRAFERNRVHIPGAVHMPLEAPPERCPELPGDRLLITFRTGGIRSAGGPLSAR